MSSAAANLYRFLRPFLFRMDPERAHGLALRCLRKGYLPKAHLSDCANLRSVVLGKKFAHPIGLAAGFDKQCEAIQPALDLGFSFLELGGVVPLPQNGNPHPRLFRLEQDEAAINRFNFNSDGFDVCAQRVKNWFDPLSTRIDRPIIGINIAKGDHYKDAAEATILGLTKFAPYVSFVTVNVSCPNERDARNLEGKEQLKELLAKVKAAQNALEHKPLLFVKISPDQTESQASDIAEVALGSGVDAITIGNTTSSRPTFLSSPHAPERGGLSGRPLFALSTKILGEMYRLTQGRIPLIGSGGIFSGKDAYAKIRAGASLLQLYTAMIYEGPYVGVRIAQELSLLLQQDGFATIGEAVGVDVRH